MTVPCLDKVNGWNQVRIATDDNQFVADVSIRVVHHLYGDVDISSFLLERLEGLGPSVTTVDATMHRLAFVSPGDDVNSIEGFERIRVDFLSDPFVPLH